MTSRAVRKRFTILPGLPDPTMIDHIEEPYIRATIITACDYIGPIMKLCPDKRGELINQEYVSGNRVELHFMLPLGEIVIDFYDKLKSISEGLRFLRLPYRLLPPL